MRTAIFVSILSIMNVAFVSANLIENGDFELGKDQKPQAWELISGTDGKWEKRGLDGRSISVTGNGNINSSKGWRSAKNPLSPNKTYRISFAVRSVSDSDRGIIFAGTKKVHWELGLDKSWRTHSFVFTTPRSTIGEELRFGIRGEGKVLFDKVHLTQVQPIELENAQIKVGKGELLHKGNYTFRTDFIKNSSNSSRTLAKSTAIFNSNRWVLDKKSEVSYKHELKGNQQLSGEVEVRTAAPEAGTLCFVEASRNGKKWQTVLIEQSEELYVQLPDGLFPTDRLYIRFRANGKLNITGYSYHAKLKRSEMDIIGATHYAEEMIPTKSIAVELETLGSFKSGDQNEVSILLSNKSEFPLDLSAELSIHEKNSLEQKPKPFKVKKTLNVGIGETWRVHWHDYEVRRSGDHEMMLEVVDRFNGEKIYSLRVPFELHELHRADYGKLHSKTATVGSIWWSSATRKISRHRRSPKKESAVVTLNSARNEYEPFQLVVRPDRYISEVKLKASALTSGKGDRIPATNVKLDEVAYLLVREPTDQSGTVAYWPDPLLPHNSPMKLSPGQNYPFWVTIKVPKGIAAGRYRGTISISGILGVASSNGVSESEEKVEAEQLIEEVAHSKNSGKNLQDCEAMDRAEEIAQLEAEELFAMERSNGSTSRKKPKYEEGSVWQETIELDLEVWDFDLSEETHIRSSVGLDVKLLQDYHQTYEPEELSQVLDSYYINFAEHRLSPYNPMSLAPIESAFEGNYWSGGTQDGTTKYDGKFSIRVTDDRSKFDLFASNRTPIAVETNRSHQLSWAVRTAGRNQEYQVAILCLDGGGMTLKEMRFDYTGLTVWRKESVTIGAFPSGTKSVKLKLSPIVPTISGRSTGTAWFDLISLRTLPNGKNLVPTPSFERVVADWNVSLRTQNFERQAMRYLDDFRFNSFQFPLEGLASDTLDRSTASIEGYSVGTPEYDILLTKYLGKVQSYLDGKNWTDKFYSYWIDDKKPETSPFVKQSLERMKNAGPKLAKMLTGEVRSESVGTVDLWCPSTTEYTGVSEVERQLAGDGVWWHLSTDAKSPYVGQFIDHSAIELRIWLWQTWNAQLDGIMIKEVNYWTNPIVYPGDLLQNPYEDSMSYPNSYSDSAAVDGNGGGRLFYPPLEVFAESGKSFSGPINSIRWELLREGIEDYEYFWTLRKLADELRNADPEDARISEAEGYTIVPEAITTDPISFTTNPDLLYTHRKRLAEMIVKVANSSETQ